MPRQAPCLVRSLTSLALFTAAGATVVACGGSGDLAFGSGASGSGGAGGDGTSTSTSTTSTTGTTTSSTGSGGASCGDGVKEGAEACDGADLGGKSCADYGFSGEGGLACTGDCVLDSSGCAATCNGQLVEPAEECDGQLLGAHTCQDVGYQDLAGAACVDCALDYSACAPTCDGQLLEPTEECDGDHLGGHTCQELGYSNADGLSCAACALDPSGCTATCDGQLLEPGEVCDGAFLDGHTCLELGYGSPAGLACTGCALDATGCSASCGNGAVEPGEECDDGNTDPDDGCSSVCTLEGSTCASAIPVVLDPGSVTLAGTTTGGGAHTASGCGSAAADRIYAVTPSDDGFLTASLGRALTAYDSVLYVTTGCSDAGANTAVLCADSAVSAGVPAPLGGEVVSIPVTSGTTYHVFVDGPAAANVGAYALTLNLASGASCGDPVLLPIEPGTPMKALGSTAGFQANAQGSCGGGSGGEVIYQVTRGGAGSLVIATDPAETSYNSALYARTACNGNGNQNELDCSNQPGAAQESISLSLSNNLTFYLRIDGSSSGGGNTSGPYGLIFTP